ARRPWLPHRLVVSALPLVMLPLVLVLAARANEPLALIIPTHLVAFFVIALACHGELAPERPGALHLTEFYFWLSLGRLVRLALRGRARGRRLPGPGGPARLRERPRVPPDARPCRPPPPPPAGGLGGTPRADSRPPSPPGPRRPGRRARPRPGGRLPVRAGSG